MGTSQSHEPNYSGGIFIFISSKYMAAFEQESVEKRFFSEPDDVFFAV